MNDFLTPYKKKFEKGEKSGKPVFNYLFYSHKIIHSKKSHKLLKVRYWTKLSSYLENTDPPKYNDVDKMNPFLSGTMDQVIIR